MVSLDLTLDLHPTAQNYARAESLGLTVDLHPTAENYTQAVKLDRTIMRRAIKLDLTADLHPTAENDVRGGASGPNCRSASVCDASAAGASDVPAQ